MRAKPIAKIINICLIMIACVISLSSLYACFEDKEQEPTPVPPIISQESEEHGTTPLAPSTPDNPQTEEHLAPETPDQPQDITPPPLPRPTLPDYNEGEQWTISVDKSEILSALTDMRIRVATLTPITMDEQEEGLVRILYIGGRAVDAYQLSMRLGLPSTRFVKINTSKDKIVFVGEGSFVTPKPY